MPVSLHSIALTLAVLYVVLGATLWALLLRMGRSRTASALWSGGAVAFGLGAALLCLRGEVPAPLSFHGANALMYAGILTRAMALRHTAGRPARVADHGLAFLGATLAYAILYASAPAHWRIGVSGALLAAGALYLSTNAEVARRRLQAAAARAIGVAEAVLATALAMHALAILLGTNAPQAVAQNLTFALVAAALLVSAVFGNLGYLGLAATLARRADGLNRDGRRHTGRLQEDVGRSNASLLDLLTQRDSLAADRERLLELLTHEIRQPLHNASGALQSAMSVIRSGRAGDRQRLADCLSRADGVMNEVRDVLDNTLCAASMLGSDHPPAMQDTEIELIVQLALGDLEPSQRAATQQQCSTQLRSVEIEPGLVRLALRNLLRQAFAQAGPSGRVSLSITESQQPPALLLSVTSDRLDPDAGPGRLSRAEQSQMRPEARSLPWSISRRVMELHGGDCTLDEPRPGTRTATLRFPLPDTEEPLTPDHGLAA